MDKVEFGFSISMGMVSEVVGVVCCFSEERKTVVVGGDKPLCCPLREEALEAVLVTASVREGKLTGDKGEAGSGGSGGRGGGSPVTNAGGFSPEE